MFVTITHRRAADGGKETAPALLALAVLSQPGTRYEDLGPDYYDRQRDIRRQVAHHVGKLGALGFEVTLARLPSPDPDPARTGNHAA
jgi:hypothetical protein